MNNSNYNNPVILNKFLKYLFNVKQYSVKTIKEYGIDLMVFFRFIKDYLNIGVEVQRFNIFIVKSVKEADILAYMVYLNTVRNCTACTRERKISAIKAFYKWLFIFYPTECICNPTENLPAIQDVRILPKYLSLGESKKLINVFNYKNCKFPERNNAIITLFLNCGLRVSELSDLKLLDLNLENDTIKIIGKGNKERIAWLNKKTNEEIRRYLDIRNKDLDLIDLEQPLFLSYRRDKLTVGAIQAIVENAYNLAGIGGKGYTTHTLRHTSATIMYQYANSDILLLKEFLGHVSVKSTEIYTHISNEKIRDAFNSNPLSNYIPEKVA